MVKDLDECFANRGLLANFAVLDEATKFAVRGHFKCCGDCRAWAAKHRMPWRVLLR